MSNRQKGHAMLVRFARLFVIFATLSASLAAGASADVDRTADRQPRPVFSHYIVPAHAAAAGMTAGPDGAVWFTAGDQIDRITTNTLTSFPIGIKNSLALSIVSGPDGSLWFNDIGTNSIGRITTAGSVTEYTIPTALADPAGIAAGSDGNLWFTELLTNKIGRITPGGTIVEFVLPEKTANPEPSGIVSGPDGALWFTNANANLIGRITTEGRVSLYGLGKDTVANNIVTGPDGALWFTDMFGAFIDRLTTGGAVTKFRVPHVNVKAAGVYGIAAGSDGALWFTFLSGKVTLGRITTSGEFTLYCPPPYDYLLAITSGPDGALWYSNFDPTRNGYAHHVIIGRALP